MPNEKIPSPPAGEGAENSGPAESGPVSGVLALLGDRKIKYLITGGFNTLAGYSICLAVYAALGRDLHVLLIGLICNVLVISFNFLTYKLFVFKTKGNWLREYLRCYAVYGASSGISMAAVWILVDGLGLSFQVAVALTMVIAVVFSWFGHSRFTYRERGGR